MDKLYLEEKIRELKEKLPMLCDSDYYNACLLIQQYELELRDDSK